MSGSLSKTIVFVNDSTGSPVPGFKAAVGWGLFFLSGKRRLAERVWNRRQLQSADTNLPSCEGGAAEMAVDVETRELRRPGARSQVIYL